MKRHINTKHNETKIGDKVTFTKYFKFGKSEEVTSTIVAIKKTKRFWLILTDCGSEFSVAA